MKKASVISIIVCVYLVGVCPSALADWNQEPAGWDSGLATSGAPIWDHQLACWIDRYFTNGYAHMKFMFGQCYSGGFIDDLQGFNNVVIGTATDYNKRAGYDTGPPWDDYATRWTNFVDNNDAGDTMKAAHDTAKLFAPGDGPQYYSNPGNLGDTLKLKNAGEDSWHAVLFVGTWYNEAEKAQLKSQTERMFDTLVNDYGYPAGNIDILFGNDQQALNSLNTPGAVKKLANRENLRATLEATGSELDSNEQFFFWGYDHGVPEPATMSLLGVGLLAVLRRRRKQPAR